MSFILGRSAGAGERRAMLGGPFTWGVGRADFTTTAMIPAPAVPQVGAAEASLQKVAVWGCVALTKAAVEMLPIDVYRSADDDTHPLPMPSWLKDLGGDGYGLHDWAAQFVHAGMLAGNNVAPILDRDSRSLEPRLLPLAHPDSVDIVPDGKGHWQWKIGTTTYARDEVWHKRVHQVPGQIMGLSPIGYHALTVGTGIEAMQFGYSWFRDGAHPSSLLTSEQNLNKDQADEAKRRFVASLRGRREPAVLGAGWKYQQVQIAPNESQFLETAGLTSAECCRIFGPAYAEVLGYDTGGSMTYSNREQRTLDLLVYSIDPWLVRIERALSDLLPQPQFVKFNRAALLRTDLLTRFKAHNIALASKFETRDEVRAIEDLPPLTPEQQADIDAANPAPVAFDQTGAKP